VISLSYRGWGASDLDSDEDSHFSPEHFGGDVVSVLDAEGIVEAAVVAQSYGGYLAVRAAYEFPARISCVVMSNTMIGFCDPVDAATRPLDWLFKLKPDEKSGLAQALADARGITASIKGEANILKFESVDVHQRTIKFCSASFTKRKPIMHGLYEQLGLCNMQMHRLNLRSKLGPLCRKEHNCTVTPSQFRERYKKPLHFITALDDGLIQWELVEYVAAKCGSDVSVKCFGTDQVGHSPYFEVPEVHPEPKCPHITPASH
jgi:pimeloyl-ACP methyl ester carboxylesterase